MLTMFSRVLSLFGRHENVYSEEKNYQFITKWLRPKLTVPNNLVEIITKWTFNGGWCNWQTKCTSINISARILLSFLLYVSYKKNSCRAWTYVLRLNIFSTEIKIVRLCHSNILLTYSSLRHWVSILYLCVSSQKYRLNIKEILYIRDCFVYSLVILRRDECFWCNLYLLAKQRKLIYRY